MLVPVVHFFEDISFVFFEFAQSVRLDLLDLVSLTLQLCIKLLDKFSLLFLTFFFLSYDRFLNLRTLLCQVLENFSLFLDASILFSFEVDEVFVHL